MRTFRSDNNSGLVPEAITALQTLDRGHAEGYGDDPWTQRAVDAFRELFAAEVEVFFVATGTAANTLAIASLTEPTGPFGLSAKRLVAVSEALAKPLAFSTKDKPCYQTAVKIAQGLTLKFQVDPVAKRLLKSDEVFTDELQGLSSGTALAAVIRPLGLVLVPHREQGQEMHLRIVRSGDAKESWPIGWPPQHSPGKTLPDLFRSLNVEIDDTPLPDALAAIKQRVNVPFLFDYNSMARQQIEPEKINVTLPRKKSFYNSIVRDLLRQAKLKHELRVDDAGKPFLWIASLKP